MKNYWIGAAMLTFGLASCGSIETLTFDQLCPASVSFPAQVQNIAVVNNMSPVPVAKNNLLTLGELNGEGRKSAEALAVALADTKYFNQVMICDSALNNEKLSDSARLLSKEDVEQLSVDLDADMIFSLDRIRIQTEKKDLYYPGMGIPWPVVRAKITPVLSIYIPGREKPMRIVAKTDSLEWDVDATPSDKQMQEEAAAFAAHILTRQLVPYWKSAERIYYGGGCVEMRDAVVYVRENDWAGAQELWQSLFNHTKSNKQKIKSAFNLALAAEMQGDLLQAEKWLKEVEKRVEPGSDEELIWKFYASQLAERLKDFPHLNSQMNRFENKIPE